MGETTLIDWAHIPGYIGGTWNPWQGCTKISPGCKNCYMFRDKKRYGQDPAKVVRSSEGTFTLPLHTKEPHAWFVCSWSDFYHVDAKPWKDQALEIMCSTPRHLYLILTKRPERIGYLPNNVWLGVTAENQETAEERIPLLLNIPAPVRFVSVEPMLGSVDLRHVKGDYVTYDVLGKSRFDYGDSGLGVAAPMPKGIDWVICGGESGPGARPMDLEWARSLRDQCAENKTQFFFKQNGGTKKIDGHWGGDLLDGQKHKEFPK